jgi:DNA-binding NarL/FixJ family response regulator
MDSGIIATADSLGIATASTGARGATSFGTGSTTSEGPRSPNLARRNLSDGARRTNPSQARSILVVDAQPLFREGVRAWLEKHPHLRCCGEADNPLLARKLIREHRPDLVLLSLSVETGEPTLLVKRLRRDFPQVCLLVMIQREEKAAGESALRAGAHGLIMKEQNTDDLLLAIDTVLRGDVYLNQELTAVMLKKAYFGSRKDDLATRLSSRELQIFGLLGLGHGTREIASKLSLSRRTVNVHRENIKHKLGLKGASGLVFAAITWVQSRPTALTPKSARELAAVG